MYNVKVKYLSIFLLAFATISSVNASSSSNDFVSNYLAHPYFFAEGGYGFVADNNSSTIKEFFRINPLGDGTYVTDTNRINSGVQFALGAGIKLPKLFNTAWLAGNAVELSLSQFNNDTSGTRTETQLSSEQLSPRSSTSHAYNISNFLVLLNYVADFKSLVKNVTPFVAVGIGFSHSTTGEYTQNVTVVGNNTPYMNSVSVPSNTGFAYDAGFGLKVSLTQKMQTSIGYRYINAANIGGGSMTGNNGSTNIAMTSPSSANNFNELYVRFIYQL